MSGVFSMDAWLADPGVGITVHSIARAPHCGPPARYPYS